MGKLCIHILKAVTRQNCEEFSFILNDSLFMGLLHTVLKSQKNPTQRIETISQVLVSQSKTFFLMGGIESETQTIQKVGEQRLENVYGSLLFGNFLGQKKESYSEWNSDFVN